MKHYSTRQICAAFTLLIAIFILPVTINSQSKRKSKRKKNQSEIPIATKQSVKKKTIASATQSSKKLEGLFTIYQDTITGSLQMLINATDLDKEFIHFAQIADGVLDAGRFRGAYTPTQIIKISKHFNKIEFTTQNTSFYFDPNSPLSKAKNANISNGSLASVSIEAFDSKKGLYLIKASDLFLKETFGQIKLPKTPGKSASSFSLGNLDKSKTKISAVKNYPDNVNILTEYVYSKTSIASRTSNAITDGRNVSIKVNHSLIAIPENEYQVRFDDPRVGYFTRQIENQTSTSTTPYRDLIHRWHLKKKNPDAKLSEPVEPIIWWIENTTPIEWRETIKNGVLEWNKAFEQAGFKNALVVKIQPDDAKWDAGDINYNVLRWTSSPQPPFGGYGPSFVNPKTGQILGADIMLEYVHFTNRVFYDKIYNTVGNAIEQDYKNCSLGHEIHQELMFANAVVSTTGASDLEMERIKKESMMALIMHEVGHTLGLNHNMKASQLFSIAQLNNANFIKGKCLTASVMDYAALNITKDRSKQGQYDDVAVGPYDVWAIKLGYQPFKLESERQALLEESTKPEHVFGNDADDMRSPGKGIDPRVNVSDQSNQQIEWSIDRMELSDNLLKNAKSNILKEGDFYDELKRAYFILMKQKGNAANTISRFIGGVYVERLTFRQDNATKPYVPVSLKDQKKAMTALEKHVFAPNAFNTPEGLYNFLASQRRGFNFKSPEDPKIHSTVLQIQKQVLKHLLHYNTLQRIIDSNLYGNQYTLSLMMTDLNHAIFKTDISNNINTFRQNLQVEYTKMLLEMLHGKLNTKIPNNAKSMALYNLKQIRTMASPSGNIASRAHKQHLQALIINGLKELK